MGTITFWPGRHKAAPSALPALPARPGWAAAPHDEVVISLVDDDGTAIAEIEARIPSPKWSEFSDPDGNLGWELAAQPLSLELDEAMEDATFARIRQPGRAGFVEVAVSRATAAPPEI